MMDDAPASTATHCNSDGGEAGARHGRAAWQRRDVLVRAAVTPGLSEVCQPTKIDTNRSIGASQEGKLAPPVPISETKGAKQMDTEQEMQEQGEESEPSPEEVYANNVAKALFAETDALFVEEEPLEPEELEQQAELRRLVVRLAQARRGVAAAKGIRDDYRIELEETSLWRNFQVTQDSVNRALEVQHNALQMLQEAALAAHDPEAVALASPEVDGYRVKESMVVVVDNFKIAIDEAVSRGWYEALTIKLVPFHRRLMRLQDEAHQLSEMVYIAPPVIDFVLAKCELKGAHLETILQFAVKTDLSTWLPPLEPEPPEPSEEQLAREADEELSRQLYAEAVCGRDMPDED